MTINKPNSLFVVSLANMYGHQDVKFVCKKKDIVGGCILSMIDKALYVERFYHDSSREGNINVFLNAFSEPDENGAYVSSLSCSLDMSGEHLIQICPWDDEEWYRINDNNLSTFAEMNNVGLSNKDLESMTSRKWDTWYKITDNDRKNAKKWFNDKVEWTEDGFIVKE